MWSWDITYLVIDVRSRKVVAWDVAERKEPAIAADLLSRTCLRERIRSGRKQSLIVHTENARAMRPATIDCWLVELGVRRPCSRRRLSHYKSKSDSVFRTAEYRPDDPRRPCEA